MLYARAKSFWAFGMNELLKEGAYLLPLRFFIALGWLRAASEKLIDPAWQSGHELSSFLTTQLAGNAVVFSLYVELIEQIFLPHVQLFSWMVMLGQLLCGIALLLGCCTNAALLGGLFMNLNFLLAGVPDPSAFYIVIQVTLLFESAGAIFGVDTLLNKRIPLVFLVAQDKGTEVYQHFMRAMNLGVIALSALMLLYGMLHVHTLDPAMSVKDPAMILVVLSIVGIMFGLISYFRQSARGARRVKPLERLTGAERELAAR